jgi:hypothetical protein
MDLIQLKFNKIQFITYDCFLSILTNEFTYLMQEVDIQRLAVCQLVKKFPVFHGTHYRVHNSPLLNPIMT